MPSILVYLCDMNPGLYNKEMNISEVLIYPNNLTFLTFGLYSTLQCKVHGIERYLVLTPTMFNDDFLPLLCLMMTKSKIDPYYV